MVIKSIHLIIINHHNNQINDQQLNVSQFINN